MQTLTQLLALASTLETFLYEANGEISEPLENALAVLENDLTLKFDGYAAVIEKMKARRDYAKSRKDEWAKVIDACDRGVETLQARLQEALMQLNRESFDANEYTVKLQKNPPKVKIYDEGMIPGKYITTIQETVISKKDLLEDLKEGFVIPGAEIEQGTRIAIKTSQKALK